MMLNTCTWYCTIVQYGTGTCTGMYGTGTGTVLQSAQDDYVDVPRSC